ncbi:MAG: hypothetical protein ACKV22_25600 [Bryobacteraceae bacterium]
MRLRVLTAAVLAAVCIASAQQLPNTVSASVSTILPASTGTATFSIQFVDANLASTVDTALGVLSDSGAATSNLTGISVSISQGFILTQYEFAVPVPASQFSTTRDRLIAIQRSLQNSATQGLGWTTAYTANADDRLRALQQALPSLLEKARQQAEVLAAGISRTLGPVRSVSAPEITSSGLSLFVGTTVTYDLQ